MEYAFVCPVCGEEIAAEVDVGEHIVDWSEECDNEDCGYKFTPDEILKIYEDALVDCFSTMVDRAHDLSQGDR